MVNSLKVFRNVLFELVGILKAREYKHRLLDCHTANVDLLFLFRLCKDEIACGNVIHPKGFSRCFVGYVDHIVFKTQAVIVNILLIDKKSKNGYDESKRLKI